MPFAARLVGRQRMTSVSCTRGKRLSGCDERRALFRSFRREALRGRTRTPRRKRWLSVSNSSGKLRCEVGVVGALGQVFHDLAVVRGPQSRRWPRVWRDGERTSPRARPCGSQDAALSGGAEETQLWKCSAPWMKGSARLQRASSEGSEVAHADQAENPFDWGRHCLLQYAYAFTVRMGEGNTPWNGSTPGLQGKRF